MYGWASGVCVCVCECCCCCYFFFTRTFFSYIYSIRLLAFTPFLCAMFFFLSDFSVCALTQGIEMCAVGFFFLETYRHRIIRNIMFTWSVHSVCICWSAHRFYEKRRKNAHNSQNEKKKKKKSMWSAYVEMHILYLYFFPSFFSDPLPHSNSLHSIQTTEKKRFSAYFVHPSANVHHINMQSKNTNLSIQFDGRKKSLLSKQCTGNWRNTKSKRKINYDMPNEERQLMCFCVCMWRRVIEELHRSFAVNRHRTPNKMLRWHR